MLAIAKAKNLDVPITRTVTDLLDGTTTISDAISQLMTRPLKEE
jgi:glycerol-3-phosphate dehydrogenase